MKRNLFIAFFIFAFIQVYAQSESWKLLNKYEVKDIDSWDVDPMSKLIFSKNDVVIKLDTNFQIQFRQSIKRFGTVTEIDARHALKTLIFSEDQQAVAFMDNTLTLHNDIKDLSKLNVAYGKYISYSGQSNRYWVFDGDNSKLVLYDDARGVNVQVMENLAGSLGFYEIDALFEIENKLFLFVKGDGVFIFDLYGSLIDKVPSADAKAIHFEDDKLYFLTDKKLLRINLKNRKERYLTLPIENVINFKVLGGYIYLLGDDGFYKYVIDY